MEGTGVYNIDKFQYLACVLQDLFGSLYDGGAKLAHGGINPVSDIETWRFIEEHALGKFTSVYFLKII